MPVITTREGTEFTKTEEVLEFLDADRCKLLYRVRRKKDLQGHGERAADRAQGSSLYILDYKKGSEYPTVMEYADEPQFKSFAPLLSPDGTKVVYNQTFSPTDIFVLELGKNTPNKVGFGANPHWYYDEKAEKLYVVYRTANESFDAVPQHGMTYITQIDENDEPVGEPIMVSVNGYGGGISADGRYLCTAYKLPCILDRQTGMLSAPWGTVLKLPDRTNQCCCPSIAPDDSGRFMVLRWPHERFSVSDFTGNSVQHFYIPEGYEEWQTPEWSTHPDYCTAAAMNESFIYDLFMIRISDGKYLKITSDGGYVHGHLWVGK